jgi:hypothetical protein
MSNQHPQFQQQPYQPAPPKKKHRGRTALIVIGSVIGGLFVLAALAPSQPANEAVQNQPVASTPVDNGPTPNPVTTPTNKPTVAKTTAPKPTATKPAMTASQEQAIGSAESYLAFTAFSRKGLIRQLSSDAGEGFSVADATYAVDHLKVNWNEQAAKKAKEYLAMTNFSRAGLIRQLESDAGEGFTHRQAVYGVTKAGL